MNGYKFQRDSTTLLLSVDGQVYSLGRKEYGRMGLGEVCEDIAKPTLITTFKDKKVVDISCEDKSFFTITDNGEVYSSSMVSNMQLGMGDNDSDLWVPTRIKGKALENKLVKSVSAGGQHTVLLASGTSALPTQPVSPSFRDSAKLALFTTTNSVNVAIFSQHDKMVCA